MILTIWMIGWLLVAIAASYMVIKMGVPLRKVERIALVALSVFWPLWILGFVAAVGIAAYGCVRILEAIDQAL